MGRRSAREPFAVGAPAPAPSPTRRSRQGARTAVLVAAVWVLALHPVLDAVRAPLPVLGALDWSAHLATAVLVIVNLGPLPRAVVSWALVASLALDVDHIPHYLGSSALMEGAPRPYTHSLASVAAVGLVAALLSGDARRRAAGVALGFGVHLIRDLGTGGVPLLWPLSREGVAVPFWLYSALAGALATRAWLRLRRPAGGAERLTAGPARPSAE